MSYSRSSARLSANERLKELRRPFAYVKVRTKSLPTPVRDSIFQNSVFQMSAILEDYLGEVTTSWFTNLLALGAQSSATPAATRAFLIARIYEDAFKRYIGLGDEQDLAVRILETGHAYKILDATETLPALDYRGKLIKDKKFPSVHNIEVLFKRLGFRKILQAVSRRTRTNVELSLRAFMDVRNSLAHESPPSITDLDVDRYFDQLDLWIGAIDREFYGHIVKVSGSAHWG